MSAAEPRTRTAALEAIAALCFGLLLAGIGPYGTFSEAGVGERLVYWLAVIMIAFAVYRPACSAGERLAQWLQLSRGLGWTAAVLVASLPLTLIVWLASFRHTPSLWPSFTEYVEFYGSVAVIGAGLMLVIWLVRSGSRAVSDAPNPSASLQTSAAARARPRLLDRLPPKLGHEIIALEMEDHYVRVHTGQGSGLLLMRMRDAVAELEGVEGAQVHRSWWVARAAVVSASRSGRRLLIELSNGTRVTVARDRASAVPAWLKDSSA
jgi:hypothetical protein